MTKGRTKLIQKDKSKGKNSNQQPPHYMSPLDMETVDRGEIYGFLENEGILPEKQKGCRRKSKGTGDQ